MTVIIFNSAAMIPLPCPETDPIETLSAPHHFMCARSMGFIEKHLILFEILLLHASCEAVSDRLQPVVLKSVNYIVSPKMHNCAFIVPSVTVSVSGL